MACQGKVYSADWDGSADYYPTPKGGCYSIPKDGCYSIPEELPRDGGATTKIDCVDVANTRKERAESLNDDIDHLGECHFPLDTHQ